MDFLDDDEREDWDDKDEWEWHHNRDDEYRDMSEVGTLEDDIFDQAKRYDPDDPLAPSDAEILERQMRPPRQWKEEQLTNFANRLKYRNMSREEFRQHVEDNPEEFFATDAYDAIDPFNSDMTRPILIDEDKDDKNFTAGDGVLAFRSDGQWWPGIIKQVIEPMKRFVVWYYNFDPMEDPAKFIREEERYADDLRGVAPTPPTAEKESIEYISDTIEPVEDWWEPTRRRVRMRDYDWDLEGPEIYAEFPDEYDLTDAVGLDVRAEAEKQSWKDPIEEDEAETIRSLEKFPNMPTFVSSLLPEWESKHDPGSPRVEVDAESRADTNQTITTVNLPSVRSVAYSPGAQLHLRGDVRRYIDMTLAEFDWRMAPKLNASQVERLEAFREELDRLETISEVYFNETAGFHDLEAFNIPLVEFLGTRGQYMIFPNIKPYELEAREAILRHDFEGVENAYRKWEADVIKPNTTEAPDWSELPALFAEAYAYRRVAELSGFPSTGVDPMFNEKMRLMRKGGEQMASLFDLYQRAMGKRWDREIFSEFIHAMTWATTADSIKYGPRITKEFGVKTEASEMLVDDTEKIFDYLNRITSNGTSWDKGEITIITNNAGIELMADLCFAAWLLQSFVIDKVVLVTRDRPVGLGAFYADHHLLLGYLQTYNRPPAERVRQFYDFAESVSDLLEDNRLEVRSTSFLSTPDPYWKMTREIADTVKYSDLVLVKGDFQFRKLIGDREFEPDAQFAQVCGYFPTPVAALRAVELGSVIGVGNFTADGSETPEMAEQRARVEAMEIPDPLREQRSRVADSQSELLNEAIEGLQALDAGEAAPYVREPGAWGSTDVPGDMEYKAKVLPDPRSIGPDPTEGPPRARGRHATVNFFGSNTVWSEGMSANSSTLRYIQRHTPHTPLVYDDSPIDGDIGADLRRLATGDYDTLELLRMQNRIREATDQKRDDFNFTKDPSRLDKVIIDEDQFAMMETEPGLQSLIGAGGRHSELKKVTDFEKGDGIIEEGDVDEELFELQDYEKEDPQFVEYLEKTKELLPEWERADRLYDQLMRKTRFHIKKAQDKQKTFRMVRPWAIDRPGTTLISDSRTNEEKEADEEVYGKVVDSKDLPDVFLGNQRYHDTQPIDARKEYHEEKKIRAELERHVEERNKNPMLREYTEKQAEIRKMMLDMVADKQANFENVVTFTWDEVREMGGLKALDKRLAEHREEQEAKNEQLNQFMQEKLDWLEDFNVEWDRMYGEPQPNIYEQELRRRKYERWRKRVDDGEIPESADLDGNWDEDDADAYEESEFEKLQFADWTKKDLDKWMNMDLRMGNYDEYDDPAWMRTELPPDPPDF